MNIAMTSITSLTVETVVNVTLTNNTTSNTAQITNSLTQIEAALIQLALKQLMVKHFKKIKLEEEVNFMYHKTFLLKSLIQELHQ